MSRARAVSAALLALGCAAPQARATDARVQGAGHSGFISDEPSDMELNPAFAADIRGGRVFGDLAASGQRSNSRSTFGAFHSRQFSYSLMVDGVRSFGADVVSLRFSPNAVNNRNDTFTLPSGPGSSSVHRFKSFDDWRVLWARRLGGGQAGVALSRELSSFVSRNPTSGNVGSHRVDHGVDAGWLSGPRGAARLGLSFSFNRSPFSGHDSTQPGRTKGATTGGTLRAVWESPAKAARFRALADSTLSRFVSDYSAAAAVAGVTERYWTHHLGAGFEGPSGPGFRWTLAAESYFDLRRALRDNASLPDVPTFSRSWQTVGVAGLEKDFTPRWTVRGRAYLFNVAQTRSKDATGAVTAGRYSQGPLAYFAGGFTWAPRPGLSFDVLLDSATSSYRNNTVTIFNDGSTRTYTLNAGMTYRFGDAPAASGT